MVGGIKEIIIPTNCETLYILIMVGNVILCPFAPPAKYFDSSFLTILEELKAHDWLTWQHSKSPVPNISIVYPNSLLNSYS